MHIICMWVIWSHHRHIYLVWFTVRQRIAMIKTRIQCTYIHFGVRTLPRQVFLVLSLLLLLGITTHDLALLSVAKQEFLGSRSCLRKAVERPLLWHQSRWQSKSREPMLIYIYIIYIPFIYIYIWYLDMNLWNIWECWAKLCAKLHDLTSMKRAKTPRNLRRKHVISCLSAA